MKFMGNLAFLFQIINLFIYLFKSDDAFLHRWSSIIRTFFVLVFINCSSVGLFSNYRLCQLYICQSFRILTQCHTQIIELLLSSSSGVLLQKWAIPRAGARIRAQREKEKEKKKKKRKEIQLKNAHTFHAHNWQYGLILLNRRSLPPPQRCSKLKNKRVNFITLR